MDEVTAVRLDVAVDRHGATTTMTGETTARSLTPDSDSHCPQQIAMEHDVMALVPSSKQIPKEDSDDEDSDVENMALVPFGTCAEHSNMLVPDIKRYSHTMKTGDVAMEQKVFERMDTLGLLEKKKQLEKQLAERLEKEMAKGDHIVGAITRSRRQREVRDRVNSVKNEIHNTIRTRVHEDNAGVKFYKVQLLMGKFTRNIRHSITGKEVFISGSSPNGTCLVKETQIEFPNTVDMTRMEVSFKAGVFKMDVPFKSQQSRMGSLTSSSCDENAMQCGISDGTCSNEDPFSEPEMDMSNGQTGHGRTFQR